MGDGDKDDGELVQVVALRNGEKGGSESHIRRALTPVEFKPTNISSRGMSKSHHSNFILVV